MSMSGRRVSNCCPLGSLMWPGGVSEHLVLRLSCESTLAFLILEPGNPLVAPYCAIPRDYLSDTPLLRAMGFLVSQHGQLRAIPPPPFLGVSPLESMRSRGAIPPLKRGISAIPARYPMKTRQMGAIPPSAILSRKGIARYGGVSRTGPLRATLLQFRVVPAMSPSNTAFFCRTMHVFSRENKNVYRHQSPPFFLKRPCHGEKLAGTNEFAFFRCKSICTGGVQNQAEKNSKMPSGRYRYKNLLFLFRGQKNRANNTKEFSEEFEGISPVEQGFAHKFTPESSPESSATSLSHNFFVSPCQSYCFQRKVQFSVGKPTLLQFAQGGEETMNGRLLLNDPFPL